MQLWPSCLQEKAEVHTELNFCAQAKLTLQTFDTQGAPVVEVRKRQHLLSGTKFTRGRGEKSDGV